MTKICIICGKEFDSNYPQQVCCSKKCSQKNHVVRKKEQKRKESESYGICKLCGKQFTPYGKEKFCSEDCRKLSIRISRNNSKKKISNERKFEREKQKNLSFQQESKTYEVNVCAYCGKEYTNRRMKYCSDECLRNAIAQNRTQQYTKICKQCGKEFITTTANKIFCCNKCYKESMKKYRADRYQATRIKRNVVCPICNKDFIVTQHNTKYCSDKCKEISRQQKKEKYVANKPLIKCAYCGKEFKSTRNLIVCCSKECSKLHNKQRKSKWYVDKQNRIEMAQNNIKNVQTNDVIKFKRRGDKSVQLPSYIIDELRKISNYKRLQNKSIEIFKDWIRTKLDTDFNFELLRGKGMADCSTTLLSDIEDGVEVSDEVVFEIEKVLNKWRESM